MLTYVVIGILIWQFICFIASIIIDEFTDEPEFAMFWTCSGIFSVFILIMAIIYRAYENAKRKKRKRR